MKKLRLTYSNVVATLALFIALGGVSWAAVTLPANSVGNREIRDGAVSNPKLAASAVSGTKLAGASVSAKNLDPNLRTALGLSERIGKTVTSASGTTLGTLIREFKGNAVGFAERQAAYGIRQANGAVIERIVGSGDQSYGEAEPQYLKEFAYKTSDCSGDRYIPQGDSMPRVDLTKAMLSSPSGPRDPSSPFAAAYAPLGDTASSETFTPTAVRLFGEMMYTHFDGTCVSFASLSSSPMFNESPYDNTNFQGGYRLYKVTKVASISGSLAGPLNLR